MKSKAVQAEWLLVCAEALLKDTEDPENWKDLAEAVEASGGDLEGTHFEKEGGNHD